MPVLDVNTGQSVERCGVGGTPKISQYYVKSKTTAYIPIPGETKSSAAIDA